MATTRPSRLRHILRRTLLVVVALLLIGIGGLIWLIVPHEKRSQLVAPSEAQRGFEHKLSRAGAKRVEVHGLRDGGLAIEGVLDGRQFSLDVPPKWNGQALLFAHGYTWPTNPTRVAIDLVANDVSGGIVPAAYAQGFAVGQSSYDKSGIAVKSGVLSTLALKHLLDRMGVRRIYLSGGSMGGSIVVALVDRYPGEFAGAIANCGVTDSWERQMEGVIDLRALYNYYLKDTDYALPGDAALDRSALPLTRPLDSDTLASLQQTIQLKRIAGPIVALFASARENPRGREAQIIARISSMTPYHADSSSFFFPLASVLLGMDDIRASFGGSPYGNMGKLYASPLLAPRERDDLNRDIQRMAADPAAQAYARTWHEATGRFTTPLVTMHNRADALVPFAQTLGLRRVAAAAGNLDHLVQFTVPSVSATIPVIGISGLKHCGFTPQQNRRLFTLIRHWAESGVKPSS